MRNIIIATIFALAPFGASATDLPVIGRIVADHDIVLSANRGGQIVELSVKNGQKVPSGTPIARSHCAEDQARYQASLASSKALELELKSQEQLREYGSATPLQVEKAQADWDRSLAEANIYKQSIQDCTILSPIDGTIVQVFVDPFEFVDRGNDLVRIVDDGDRYVEFLAPVSWYAELISGDRVRVELAELGKTIFAQIDQIGVAIEPVSQTVRMRAKLAQTNTTIPVGIAGQVLRTNSAGDGQ